MAIQVILPGEPAPWFRARSPQNPTFNFDPTAGRYIVMSFFGTAGDPAGRTVVDHFIKHRGVFDGSTTGLFLVSTDPEDERAARVAEVPPGIYVFWDFDGAVSRLFRVTEAVPGSALTPAGYYRCSVVLDQRLRVFAVVPLDGPAEQHVPRVMQALAALKAADAHPTPAPVLIVPRIFEPGFCQALMKYYDDRGGGESGFMREIDGKTVGVVDHNVKRRRDQLIEDEALQNQCKLRIHGRLVPEIAKAFQFQANRIERYIVGCYDSGTGGYFTPHRDNTTKGTAHRKFAVSLVLNTGAFEGGRVRFPEFGPMEYAPPAGGAVVFSCSLLHEATPVTKGKRYVFLPFLYDDAAAAVREKNKQFLGNLKPGE